MRSLRTFAPLLKWVIIGVVFVLAAGLSAYLTVNFLVGRQDAVIVPDLAGKDVVYALEILSDLGLNTKVEGVEFDPQVPKNHIILQNPEPGSEIKKGRDVRLILSKGPSTVATPRLTGVSIINGRLILEENGLCAGKLARVYDCDSQKGMILAQFPAPSKIVDRGSCIDLLVSQGPSPVKTTMIDVTGLNLSKAMLNLDMAHLSLGTIKTVFKTGLENETVLRQNPGAGYPVVLGEEVDLVVSRHRKSAIDISKPAVSLFRYRAPTGFLNQHVKILASRPTTKITLFDDYLKPGRSVWLLIDRSEPTTVSIYVDGSLASMEFFD